MVGPRLRPLNYLELQPEGKRKQKGRSELFSTVSRGALGETPKSKYGQCWETTSMSGWLYAHVAQQTPGRSPGSHRR